MFVQVLAQAASWQDEPLLTYLVPTDIEDQLRVGQLVAIPYGDRLIEGIVWNIQSSYDHGHCKDDPSQSSSEGEQDRIRPLHTILDPEPALLPHQQAIAEWMADYYVTPLPQVALMMLPPGLIQRSQIVLHLAKKEKHQTPNTSLQVQALIGLLLDSGELDIERLKQMLGPKRAKEILHEALTRGLVQRQAQLQAPRVHARKKRLVRLIAGEEALEHWRQLTTARIQHHLVESTEVTMAPDNVRRRPHQYQGTPNPWTTLEPVVSTLLDSRDRTAILAQRQLVAVELLQHNQNASISDHRSDWTPGMLCKASKLTSAQLQTLIREQIITIEDVEVQRNPLQDRIIKASTPLSLTPNQQAAVNEIIPLSTGTHEGYSISSLRDVPPPSPILLHGITGSGKTEVYLQALARIIAQGKRGIVLVPEIALTTQAIQRIAGRFPDRVAIVHSALSMGERYDEWRRIRAGKIDVVIGSRSALFAPLPDIGLIILDEEHEPAYKETQRKPTYHAREVAIALGRIMHIPVVLGSATPAVETFYRAEQGQYRLVELPHRIGAALPPVEIVDLRSELHAGNTSIISRRLHHELDEILRNRQQAILFLNRRGAASFILCRECGFIAMCDHCDMPLTYHVTECILLCHYCNSRGKILHSCPQCKSTGIRYFGLGTEKVQATIQRSFPSARLLRWDRDTAPAGNHRAHAQLLESFANREADILIGTQMIAKGLDLPGVTLVGVISADIALTLPDFATAERSFTLLTQVAGRAGRGEEEGHVIIQTFNPQHFCIDAASRHDYHEFYATEIDLRRRYNYPPFRQFVKYTYSHQNRQRAQNEALLLRERLDEWIARLGLISTDIVGPAPALMERIRGKYRWQMIVRGPDLHPLLRVIDTPGWEVDINPVSTL